jgi:hypothetical protein
VVLYAHMGQGGHVSQQGFETGPICGKSIRAEAAECKACSHTINTLSEIGAGGSKACTISNSQVRVQQS